MIFGLKSLPSFQGKAKSIKRGCAFYVPSNYPCDKRPFPLHYVCTVSPQTDPIFHNIIKKNAEVADFFESEFFGASLYYGQIVFFGPELAGGRSSDIGDWKPISWIFENSMMGVESSNHLYLGVINGYSHQYLLKMNESGRLYLNNRKGDFCVSLRNSSLWDIISQYEERIFSGFSFSNASVLDDLTKSFIKSLK